MELEYGPQWYRKTGEGIQPEAIDIRSMMELVIAPETEIVLNYAYGDWRQLEAYATVLREFDIRLMQFFPQPRGRQDAVSEAIIEEVTNILQQMEGLNTVFFMGGNEKFLPLIELLKSRDIEMKGCGPSSSANAAWENSVGTFHPYRSVARPIQGEQQNFADARDTHEALVATFLDLRAQYGKEWIRQVKIKPVLLRHLPNFDETAYGYSSFGAYLGDQREVLDRRQPNNAREAEYALLEEVIPEQAKQSLKEEDNPDILVPHYLRVAAQQGVRMPPPEIMWIGIDIYAAFLESGQIFDSFNELDDECLHQLQKDIPEATLTDAKKIRQVLFKCYLFRPSKDGTIGFQDEVTGLEDIEDRYFRLMINRIGRNINTPLDFKALSLALTGEDKSTEFLEAMHRNLKKK